MTSEEQDELFGIRRAPRLVSQQEFPHVVTLPEKARVHTPGSEAAEKLRFILWLTGQNLDNTVDYITESWCDQDRRHYKSFAFRNPNKAMLFKLSFAEVV